MSDRHLLEKAFHDRREYDRQMLTDEEFIKKYPNKKFYRIANNTSLYLSEMFRKHISTNTRVLDYCCGLGHTSVELASLSSDVYGIDISSESVATAVLNVRKQNADIKRENFAVMNAENTSFPDNYFDVIVCNGVLHHLDTKIAFRELNRILRVGGVIIANESLGYNPIIQAYRYLTPSIRTAWETDHILTGKDFKRAEKYFHRIEKRYFNIFSIVAIPLIDTFVFSPALQFFRILDKVATKLPLVREMAWQVVFTMHKRRESFPDHEKPRTTIA